MGKPVSSDVKRVETAGFNTTINKEVFKDFKDCCAYLGYPMNVVFETFMRQYANRRFNMSKDDILKWSKDNVETDRLNTMVNKEVYINFRHTCKRDGYYIKHVITAFMEKFISNEFILEYVNIAEVNKGAD